LQVRSYTNKDGEKRYATEIIADNVEFIKLQKNAEKGEERAEKPRLEPVQGELPF
jgi:single-stranded DNA-binding protein